MSELRLEHRVLTTPKLMRKPLTAAQVRALRWLASVADGARQWTTDREVGRGSLQALMDRGYAARVVTTNLSRFVITGEGRLALAGCEKDGDR